MIDGWKNVKLGDITIKITSGGTPSRSKDEYFQNGTINWLKTGELKDCYIFDAEEKITEEAIKNSSAKIFPIDTLLIAMYGATIGRTAYLKTECTTNQACCAIIFNKEVANPFFYWKYFYFIKKSLIGLGRGAGQPNISQGIIKELQIPLPPLKEQEKIADILSSADDKIDAIVSQIQKAEILKKGLLQKLLSEGIGHSEFKDSELGKIPLGWEVVELGDFSTSISKKNKDNQITDVVSVTKYNGIVNSLEYFKKKVFSDNISTYKIIERNQFAYATIHLDEGSIGYLNICDIAVLSPMYSVFKVDFEKVNREFFYSLIKSHKMIKIYEHIGLGSVERRKSISFNIFKKIKIPLPPLKEQKQIAEILSTSDEKLEVLRAKKQKYETLKKGLLQKLLSGEIRV